MDKTSEEARRALRRQSWSVAVHHLDDATSDDLSADTSATERLEMMWQLTLDAWTSAGRLLPTYDRQHMPGRILRKPHVADAELE